ncbi:hypothetical protein AAFF_G00141500 [Aldrovandia affinis]|uniref:Uncharacterized protein n=1 Tax=Aldrovandia affinis TaxID=143900 RepID=A0AAD7TCL0_9TELE|nr:hypothetical protein AAFF_G00141500 [Aldrovandia affinis]
MGRCFPFLNSTAVAPPRLLGDGINIYSVLGMQVDRMTLGQCLTLTGPDLSWVGPTAGQHYSALRPRSRMLSLSVRAGGVPRHACPGQAFDTHSGVEIKGVLQQGSPKGRAGARMPTPPPTAGFKAAIDRALETVSVETCISHHLGGGCTIAALLTFSLMAASLRATESHRSGFAQERPLWLIEHRKSGHDDCAAQPMDCCADRWQTLRRD